MNRRHMYYTTSRIAQAILSLADTCKPSSVFDSRTRHQRAEGGSQRNGTTPDHAATTDTKGADGPGTDSEQQDSQGSRADGGQK